MTDPIAGRIGSRGFRLGGRNARRNNRQSFSVSASTLASTNPRAARISFPNGLGLKTCPDDLIEASQTIGISRNLKDRTGIETETHETCDQRKVETLVLRDERDVDKDVAGNDARCSLPH
jgi:hypothetical protein